MVFNVDTRYDSTPNSLLDANHTLYRQLNASHQNISDLEWYLGEIVDVRNRDVSTERDINWEKRMQYNQEEGLSLSEHYSATKQLQ